MAVYNDILSAVQSQILSLGLTFNAKSVPVTLRKLPAIIEEVDTVPMIAVCPKDEPEEYKRIGFEKTMQVTYQVEIVIIAPGNRDFESNLDVYLSWRESIRNLFRQPPLAGVPEVWMMMPKGEVPIDRDNVNSNYDYSGLVIEFTTVE